MAPRTEAFKRLQQRLRRSLKYGDLRIDCLTAPLSQMVVEYFDHHSPYDYLDTDFAASSVGGFVDPCTLIAAMIYLERLRVRKPKDFLSRNPNELYLASLIIANKFLFDGNTYDYLWLDDWVEESKITKSMINQLELRMLYDLEWDLMISGDEYEHALQSIERYVATRSLKQSGILSYGDAHALMSDAKPLFKHMSRFLTMCASLASAYLLVWTLSVGTYLTAQKAVTEMSTMNDFVLVNDTFPCSLNSENALCDSGREEVDSELPEAMVSQRSMNLLNLDVIEHIPRNRTLPVYDGSCVAHRSVFSKNVRMRLIC
ncbi:unnamed protein product [Bursaphelenchus xylophilus]|uniref:Protein CNPPD1 n=1 Tax=Bursaphelenchus xylophilus TaxID=6326 RepID=A0A1I7RSK3_BURXY|nr:unnamed protein product [Bursaphelenchus xylophilus]CAG9122891.1 unnamed protein product [Bursaphelenchus xylophilus]